MEKNENRVVDELVINKIYLIRGEKVMLDSDLAALYGVETKVLNQSVKRNLGRFPTDFMFKLTDNEAQILRSQFVTSKTEDHSLRSQIVTLEENDSLKSQIATSKDARGGTRYLPMAFTEQGVAMLSSVLKSQKAIEVNIQIIRIFTRLRKALLDNTELRLAIEELRKKTDNNTKNIEVVFAYFDELIQKKENVAEKRKIGF